MHETSPDSTPIRALGLIPARGGSKGVPRKNLRTLAGKPLLAWTAESALAARGLSRVILSTEDAEIAQTGRELGLDVPFLRPAELATDRAATLPVVQHVLRACADLGESYDAVCLLQPTQPFRSCLDIEKAIALFRTSAADSVVSVLPLPAEHHPHWAYLEVEPSSSAATPSTTPRIALASGASQPTTRRQDLPRAFHREGSIYITRSRVVMAGSLYGESVVGYEMDPDRSVNIDTLDDWQRAEEMAQQLGRGVTAGVLA